MDKELKTARDKIKNAALVKKDDSLYAPLYHNISIFKRFFVLVSMFHHPSSSPIMYVVKWLISLAGVTS